eukprot:gene27857-34414_t
MEDVDDRLRLEEETEEEEHAEGELLLGKYAVKWKEGPIEACQRQPDGWEDEDPKIRWGRVFKVQPDLADTKYLKYMCAFFPIPILPWWYKAVTKAGREKYGQYFLNGNRDFTPGLFWVLVGDFFYMVANPGMPREEYFEQELEFPRVSHNLGRFGLVLKEFQHILSVLNLPECTTGAQPAGDDPQRIFFERCGPPRGTPSSDIFLWVRRFIDSWNAWILHTFSPSHLLNPDETMVRWISKYCLPGVMWVPRKPDPLGHELKSVADCVVRVMIFVELQEGKERDRLKPYTREHGTTTAFLLRVIDALQLRGKGKEFYADSWFGSVKAAVLMLERGNYLKGLVKTNTKFYPLAELKALAVGVDKQPHSTRAVSMVANVKLDTGTKQIGVVYHKRVDEA